MGCRDLELMFDMIVFGFTFASILTPCLFDFHFGGAAPPLCPLVCQGHVVLALSLYLWKFQRFVHVQCCCTPFVKSLLCASCRANRRQVPNRRLMANSQIEG